MTDPSEAGHSGRRRRRKRQRRRPLVGRSHEGSAARRLAWAVVGASAFVAAKLVLGF